MKKCTFLLASALALSTASSYSAPKELAALIPLKTDSTIQLREQSSPEAISGDKLGYEQAHQARIRCFLERNLDLDTKLPPFWDYWFNQCDYTAEETYNGSHEIEQIYSVPLFWWKKDVSFRVAYHALGVLSPRAFFLYFPVFLLD
jgi:hypothetical protein